MKSSIFWGLVLVSGCLADNPPDKADLPALVKKKVEEINQALIKADYGKVVDLTYPKLVENIGGREKMISVLKSGREEMKAQGVAFSAVKVNEPKDFVSAGNEMFVVVTFLLQMTAPGGKLKQKTFVIGISDDKGKTWTFVNGDVSRAIIKQLLPNLPDKLKLPEKQEPVFEKEKR